MCRGARRASGDRSARSGFPTGSSSAAGSGCSGSPGITSTRCPSCSNSLRLAADDRALPCPRERIGHRRERLDLAHRRPGRRRQNRSRFAIAPAIAAAAVTHVLCVVSVSSCAGVWCGGTRVMKKRVSKWRVSIGGVTQCANSSECVEREAQAFVLDDRAKRPRAAVHVRAVLLEARVNVGAGERHELTAGVAREQDAGFLEQLARRGHVISDRLIGWQIVRAAALRARFRRTTRRRPRGRPARRVRPETRAPRP